MENTISILSTVSKEHRHQYKELSRSLPKRQMYRHLVDVCEWPEEQAKLILMELYED